MPADLNREAKTSKALQGSGERLREMATAHQIHHQSHELKLAKQPKRLIDIAKNPSHRPAPLHRQQVGSKQYAWMNATEAAEYKKTLDQYAKYHLERYGNPTEIDPRREDSSIEAANSLRSVSDAEADVTTSNQTGRGSNPSVETVNSDYWMLNPEGGWEPVRGR